MQVQRIATTEGIDDIKLIAETVSEKSFLRQLADAGTLVARSNIVGDSITFRPISVMEEEFISSELTTVNTIGTYNFDLRQNEDRSFELNFESDGEPIDLSVYSAIELQVKKSKNGTAVITLSVGQGLAVSGEDNEKLIVSFESSQTDDLTLSQYYYDVLFKTAEANTYLLEGTITIIPSVTR